MATAKERYEALKVRRQPFLDRAWDYAELSIPSLLPRHAMNRGTQKLVEPYQAFVSRCVINLSSQLLMALLPPGSPFFRLTVPPAVLVQEGKLEVPAELQKGLAMTENLIMSEIERRAWRQPTNLTLQLLIVTGNALEQMLPDNRIRVFRLDQYVVVRDYAGNLLECLLHEKMSPQALPEGAQALVTQKATDEDVDLYTWVRYTPKGYMVHQEIEDKVVPGSEGIYKVSPFIPLRWSAVPGEDYGRGKCEEHGGDIRSFEALSKSLVDGAAMAARHIMLVRPNATGTNLKSRIAKANNGDVIVGNEEDVSMLQFENVTGLQLAQAELQRLAENLGAAFLLRGGVVRDSERTTATEVRMVAEELEGTLGGVYSLLSEEMMRTRLGRLMLQMQANESLPPIPDGTVEPQIIVGLEALNREKDVMRVMNASEISALLDPNKEYTKTGDLLKRAYVGLGLPAAVRSDEEVMERRRQMAQIEAAAQAAGVMATNATRG